jgi:carboxypeptidase D
MAYFIAIALIAHLAMAIPHIEPVGKLESDVHHAKGHPWGTAYFSNPQAAKFMVDSSKLPLVTFPLQDSWAGRLPISANAGESRVSPISKNIGESRIDCLHQQLFFWYWPASKSGPSDTLTIWLNGGPGCSSLGGFLQV